MLEQAYPYSGEYTYDQCNQALVNSQPDGSIKIPAFSIVNSNDPHAIKVLLKNGPVAASLCASSTIFQFYSEGIIDDLSAYSHGKC